MNILKSIVTFISIIGMTPSLAQAQQEAVLLSSTVQLVVPANEETGTAEEVRDTLSVVPQDLLIFTVSYRNAGTAAVTDMLIVNAVPASVRLTEESANTIEVSVDNGASWGDLGSLVVVREGGEATPATIDDISHLRWKIALIEPGEAGSVEFRAIVK